MSLRPAEAEPSPTRDDSPMIRIPAGPFQMGSEGDGEPDERPQRSVALPGYWIDAHEVTNAQYRAFCAATGRRPPPNWNVPRFLDGKEKWPVVNVTWEDAAAYAKWAGKRLPTEAEWEKAARGMDGRVFPWGNEAADKKRAALDEDMGAVAGKSAGASVYGVLDMAGNAWEWTADWYDAYPGAAKGAKIEFIGPNATSPRSIHYGKKYKVVRGGGALGYYGIANTGRCADRARALPFAGYDGTGFRCVRDEGPPRVFDTNVSAALLSRPRVGIVHPVLSSPVMLDVTEPAGAARTNEIVASGLPFPEGALRSPESVRLVDEAGKGIPVASYVAGTWRDGSVQWLMLRFPCTVGAKGTRRLRLHWRGTIWREPKGWERARIARPDGPIRVAAEGRALRPVSGPGDGVTYVDGAETPLFRLNRRGDDDGKTTLTLSRVSDKPLVHLTAWETPIPVPGTRSVLFGGDVRAHRFAVGPTDKLEMRQESDRRYVVIRNGRVVASGTRAPGWVTVYDGERSVLSAVRDFRQQHPMALAVDRRGVTLRFVTDKEPFEADRGIAKTVAFVVRAGKSGDTGERTAIGFQHPLFAVAPPNWYCGTKALGDLEPYDLDRFSDYETPVEAALDLWMRSRPTGFRHWGDAYMGGPYKGKNAYANLEYDVPYDFLMQFARTGRRKYLEAAIAGARHQADIDTNHATGQPWKHSPRHTETPAELGHVFLRGLIEFTHFTGDPRGLETAREIGDWLRVAIGKPGEVGNERQIGWGLYALTAVYAATGDRKYLDGAKVLIDRLVAGQDATGKFPLRWDNRISFFNGLALAGMRGYYEATGDERVASSMLRLLDRTLGYYPEYAGRTLDGIAWAYARTGDRRYLTLAVRTWETTQEYLAGRDWGPDATLFATRYLPFAVRYHLLPEPPKRPLALSPAQLSTENGLFLTRIETPRATVFLRDATGEPFDLVVFRQSGIADGTVTVASSGKSAPIGALRFPGTARASVRQVVAVPGGAGPRVIRVTLDTSSAKAWNIVTSRALPRVVRTPSFAGVERLVPRIYFRVHGDTLRARFTAAGEGFKGAVLLDPAGRAVAAVTKFIDFGDEKTVIYELRAAIPTHARGAVWGMDIQGGRLLALDGARPFFATSPAACFDPNGVY